MPLNFPSNKELRKHTKRHWQEFNLANEDALDEYLALARTFCEGSCPKGTDECTRTCDTKVDRFCELSGEFSVMTWSDCDLDVPHSSSLRGSWCGDRANS